MKVYWGTYGNKGISSYFWTLRNNSLCYQEVLMLHWEITLTGYGNNFQIGQWTVVILWVGTSGLIHVK